MIDWLTGVVAWVQGLFDYKAPPPPEVSAAHPYLQVLRRLDIMDARLAGIEVKLGLPAGPGEPIAPPEPRLLSCGHHSGSYATHPDGRTECLDCHQRQYRMV